MRGALIFDLDDTLYSERDFAFSGFRAASKAFAESHGVVNFGDICAQIFDSGETQKIFDKAMARLGLEADPDTIADLVLTYRQHKPEISLPGDTARFLRQIDGSFGIGIITDGLAATQRAKVEALRLDSIADLIICTGEWGKAYWKPHPRAYIEMEKHFALSGSQMIYVADNPVKDFITPNERGWLTVQVNRPRRVHPIKTKDNRLSAKETIESFDALGPLLERYLPPARGSGKKAFEQSGSHERGLYRH